MHGRRRRERERERAGEASASSYNDDLKISESPKILSSFGGGGGQRSPGPPRRCRLGSSGPPCSLSPYLSLKT